MSQDKKPSSPFSSIPGSDQLGVKRLPDGRIVPVNAEATRRLTELMKNIQPAGAKESHETKKDRRRAHLLMVMSKARKKTTQKPSPSPNSIFDSSIPGSDQLGVKRLPDGRIVPVNAEATRRLTELMKNIQPAGAK